MEYGIGLKPDAPQNEIIWNLQSSKRCGCEKYRFNGHLTTIIADQFLESESRKIFVESDGEYKLTIYNREVKKTFSVVKGKNEFIL